MCCDFFSHGKSICDFANIKVSETEKGVNVEISPKDASKIDSFKALAKAHQDICDCC